MCLHISQDYLRKGTVVEMEAQKVSLIQTPKAKVTYETRHEH